MKTKDFDKKLALKKETISNLDKNELDSARGGTAGPYTKASCLTYTVCTRPECCEATTVCKTNTC